MKLVSKVLAAALIAGASALPLQSANAWGGPWGGNMFGMDFGQSGPWSHGYGPYGGGWGGYPYGGGWGGPYGGYGYPYGGYGYPAYGVPTVVAPAAPAK